MLAVSAASTQVQVVSVLPGTAASTRACWCQSWQLVQLGVLTTAEGAAAASTQRLLAAGAASTAFCAPVGKGAETASTQGLLMSVLTKCS